MTTHRITPTEYTAQVWALLHTSDVETINNKVTHPTDEAIKHLRKEDLEEYRHIAKTFRTFYRRLREYSVLREQPALTGQNIQLRVESMVDNDKYMFSGPNFIEEMRISRQISKERRKEEREARKKK